MLLNAYNGFGARRAAGGGETDPLFAYVVNLLPLQGDFVDVIGPTWSSVGTPGVTATAGGADFPSSNGYLTAGADSGTALGTGDYCIELFVNYDSVVTHALWDTAPDGDGNRAGNFVWYYQSGSYFLFSGGANVLTVAQTPTAGVDHYLCLDRYAGITSMYYNTARIGQTAGSLPDSSGYRRLGAFCDAPLTYGINGPVKHVRRTRGASRHQGAATITVPTPPFPES